MSLPSTPRVLFLERHFAAIAVGVLVLAAFNLTFRLGSEIVTEWDESLYALSAWEMVKTGHWIGTTFGGVLDYYNTKPPLNIWLIALSFKVFGVSLIALRLPAALSAWLTVLVLQVWLRRAVGETVAIFGSLVLATSFGFLYAHAGRSANPDALFTLLVLLTVVTLWAAREHRARLAWLSPILAAVFLLKGMALLMPLTIVIIFERWRAVRERRLKWWRPLAGVLSVVVIPIVAWMWARWQIDEWAFIQKLFVYDFVQGTLTALEGHAGTPFFYLDVLQRDQFSWLAAGLVAVVVCPPGRRTLWRGLRFWRGVNGLRMLVGTWASVTLLIPTAMQTKLPWYLNSFYPVFAVGVGWLLARATLSLQRGEFGRWRQLAVVGSVAAALGATEARLGWYSFYSRDLTRSAQGVLLGMREQLAGRQVFRDRWDNGEVFVIKALIGADPIEGSSADDCVCTPSPNAYWFSTRASTQSDVVLAGSTRGDSLYQRRE